MKIRFMFLMVSLTFWSAVSMAALDFGNFYLPEDVKEAVDLEIKNKCPLMHAREHILVTNVTSKHIGSGEFEYVVTSKGRGYVVQDPFWNLEVTVIYEGLHFSVMSTEFNSQEDCW